MASDHSFVSEWSYDNRANWLLCDSSICFNVNPRTRFNDRRQSTQANNRRLWGHMSNYLQTESGVAGEKGKRPLVSFPLASSDRVSFDIDVNGRDRESEDTDYNEGGIAAKNQPLAQQFMPQSQMHRDPSRVAIRSGGRVVLLNPRDVITVLAQGNYALLRRQAESHLVREKISSIAEKLKCYGFIQIHRSVLVNRLYVEEIRGVPTGEYILRIRSGKEYTVTRTYKKMLTHLAEVWIGANSFTAEL